MDLNSARAHIEDAIDSGYDDFESLKRITGITTGQCQGKTCMDLARGILERKTGKAVAQTTRIRSPIDPIPLGSLVTFTAHARARKSGQKEKRFS